MKMFKLLSLSSMLFISFNGFSQDNVGVGVAAPTEALSVARGLNIDHNNHNAGSSLLNGLRFGNTTTNLQMVGISSNRAGATEPFSLDFYTANQRRMIITPSGLVGINTVPSGYFLEVGGTVRGNYTALRRQCVCRGGKCYCQQLSDCRNKHFSRNKYNCSQ